MNKYRLTFIDSGELKELELDSIDLDDALRRGHDTARQACDGRRVQVRRIERVGPYVLPPAA